MRQFLQQSLIKNLLMELNKIENFYIQSPIKENKFFLNPFKSTSDPA